MASRSECQIVGVLEKQTQLQKESVNNERECLKVFKTIMNHTHPRQRLVPISDLVFWRCSVVYFSCSNLFGRLILPCLDTIYSSRGIHLSLSKRLRINDGPSIQRELSIGAYHLLGSSSANRCTSSKVRNESSITSICREEALLCLALSWLVIWVANDRKINGQSDTPWLCQQVWLPHVLGFFGRNPFQHQSASQFGNRLLQ